MAALNRTTLRRLQNLQQISSVWEGDRRPLSPEAMSEEDRSGPGDCILWVDGSEGVVRAMDMVAPDSGPEAIVRALLRAMEHPQSPAPAARPQKIVVKDRQIQFFLRGVLQDLDIAIDYVPDLPLIDEIFRGMQEVALNRPPQLPPQYANALEEKAREIWRNAPWISLAEHQIISIELNKWDVGTIYISVMGRGGMDYGVLLYRSLESLTQFRQRVVAEESFENLEQAFLGQDCLFVTFESIDDDDDDEELDLASLPASSIEPNFGNLHPLEGLRSILYEEEALTVLVILEAFNRFLRASRRKLADGNFPAITSRYRIPLPDESEEENKLISVKVSTLPEVAEELWLMVTDDDDDDDDDDDWDIEMPLLRDDLLPPNSLLSLGVLPWETVDVLRTSANFYQPATVDIKAAGDGLPVLLIQTSIPKAKGIIKDLQEVGGVKAFCFNSGEDPFGEQHYDLAILQVHSEELYLLGEFLADDGVHGAARKKWDIRCKNTKGWCGVIIAKGITGASRGNPQYKDMLALFEMRYVSPKELGIGPLQLMPMF